MPGASTSRRPEALHTGRRLPRLPCTHHCTDCLTPRDQPNRDRLFPADAQGVSKLHLQMPMEFLRWALLRKPIFLPRLYLEYTEAVSVTSLLLQIQSTPYLSPLLPLPCLSTSTPTAGGSEWDVLQNAPSRWSLPQSTTLQDGMGAGANRCCRASA